ncbi:MAG: Crp/Fnr family transcriptional regulator [Candidatus Saccharimonadales bacterium]
MPTRRTIRAKQTIFYQGEAAGHIYRIVDGLVRAYVINENGAESTVAFFGPHDYFPLTAAFDIAPVTLFYYETVIDSTLEASSSAELVSQLQADAAGELHRFATRYVGALLHISALTQQTASLKLAHTLRYLSVRFGEKLIIGSRTKIGIKLTQHDLASLSNLSRETVSIELGRLKKHDILTVKEKYYFINIAKLNAYMNEETPTIRLT